MGLATAVNRLKESKAKSRIIILLTDGVNNSGFIDPQTASELAVEYGIKTYTIGLGSNGMALSPVAINNGKFQYSRIQVEIDEKLLKEIASETGGKYFRATNNKKLEDIYDEIDKLEKTEIEEFKYYNYEEKFRPLVLLALGLLVLEFFASTHLSKNFYIIMFQLEEDIWFWLLLIPLGMLLLFLWTQLWKKRTKRKFSDLKLLKRLSPDQSLFKSVLKFITLSLGFICLIIALVNPKIGTSLQTVKREGVDIVFAIDVSKSMLAEDIVPNRLEKAKQLITQIINNLVSDRVGIIAYAAKAVPQLPITTDYSAAKMFLQNMNTDMLSSQGTAIDEAIQLSRSYYNDEEQTNRVLVIISDGEDHNNLNLDMAETAAKEGIKIFTIGVGTEKRRPYSNQTKWYSNEL